MKLNLDLEKHRRKNDKAIRRAAYDATRRFSKKQIIIIVCLLAAVMLFITLNERFFKIEGIPTWNDIYKSTGLMSDIPLVDGEVSVHYVDVGQGDCELIRTATKNVLIDSGERDQSSTVINYIKSQNIERLDYIIVTHPHSDHAGCMSNVIDEFDVGTVILPKIQESMVPTTNTYLRMLQSIENKNIPIEYAKPGNTYTLDDAIMTVLSPLDDYNDLNNYSVAVKFQHGENSFLFTGDIEKEVENDILDSGADVSAKVIKMAHHGSTTSNQKKFLNAVDPEYAVIEVGTPNSYGHPHDKIIQLLENMGVALYRTDRDGNIVFVSDGDELKVVLNNDKNSA